MAIYKWSALVNGQTISTFNANSDTLQFDDSSISASSVGVASISSTSTQFAFGEKMVTVHIPLFGITTSNVDFVNDSMLAVGDNLPSTTYDQTGGDLVTGVHNDQLIAGAGGYILHGGAGNDLLRGGADDDELDGGTGNDIMSGGRGDDIYHVDSTADTLIENDGRGNDHVISSATFALPGAVESLELIGTAAINGTGNNLDNIIDGNDAANTLTGSTGNDDLTGNGGNDRLFGGPGADTLDGGDGFDYAYYTGSSVGITIDMTGDEGSTGEAAGDSWGSIEEIVGSTHNDRIIGDSDNNKILGYAGNDTILGNTGNDTLMGGEGDDFIDGGLGKDQLFGEGGNDTFYFDTQEANGDVIRDFQGNGAAAGDRLVFHGFGTAADGAKFIELNPTHWQITSGGEGLIKEILIFPSAPEIHPTDYTFT